MTALFGTLSNTVIAVWVISAFMLSLARMFGRDKPELFRILFAELKPLYLPAVAVAAICQALIGIRWHDPVFTAIYVWNWYSLKDEDDDDRWKRRIEQAYGAVARVGNRLSVVPAGAP